MSTTIRRLAAIALASACAAGVAAAPASAAKVTATADGTRVTGCSVRHIIELHLFARGLSCKRALSLAHDAASRDRWCPPGWRTRARVDLVAKGAKDHPTVTLCRKGTRAFTYHLPTG